MHYEDWPIAREPGINGDYVDFETPSGNTIEVWYWASGMEPTLSSRLSTAPNGVSDFDVLLGDHDYRSTGGGAWRRH